MKSNDTEDDALYLKLVHDMTMLCDTINELLFDGCREWYWVGGMVGGTCYFDDTDYLTTEDMMLVLRENVTFEQYCEWHYAELDHPGKHINLHSWLLGARHEMLNKK